MTALSIRTMRPEEIALAVDWAAAEGWNPGLGDAACFATVDPGGFLIGELDGAPAATISCLDYDARFAFLGFYIVRTAGSPPPDTSAARWCATAGSPPGA